jgi:hypothetical protein
VCGLGGDATYKRWDMFDKHTQNHDITIVTITGQKQNPEYKLSFNPSPSTLRNTHKTAAGKKEKRNPKNRRTVQKGKKTHRKLVSGAPQKGKEKTQ